MAFKSSIADKLPGTVVITDFAERRAREMVREESPEEDALASGTRLGRYLIIERLGGGGMGVVYKAHDTELRRTVALKILPPHLCRHPDYLNRFRAEAQAHARLNSPYIITLYSLLELPAGEVLVLEYVEGQTLEQRLRAGGPLTPAEAVRIFDQALRAVEHAHAAGVVHRDLKPANIFLTRDAQVKLMDFGVAKLMDRPEHAAHRTMVGTLLYIAPEQINGHSTDFRSDIYTLGVTLFEAVTGRLPFERRSDYALMHAHVQERPPRPRELQRGLPAALEAVILKTIEKDPNRRFQSAAEFRIALLKTGLIYSFRTIEVIAWANLVFALVLWLADGLGMTIRRLEHTTTVDALAIGLAQVVALVPGVSRAGITMTMARFLGYERVDAARFSMLLSIPTIAGLGAATALELAVAGDLRLQADAGFAAALAFVAAIVSIWFMMAILRRTTMLPFVIYRIVLGIVLLAIVYGLADVPGTV